MSKDNGWRFHGVNFLLHDHFEEGVAAVSPVSAAALLKEMHYDVLS
jgi:hypothetical protein